MIQNAGSIFVGEYSAQAAGDYASGPNHVLPTAGVARFRGGLSVHDFVKVITVQKLSKTGLPKDRHDGRMSRRNRRVEGARTIHSREVPRCLGHARQYANCHLSSASRRKEGAAPRLQREHRWLLSSSVGAIAALGAEDLARYPEREPVEEVVADYLGVKPEELLLTNGVDEAIHLVCETYLEPSDEVLIVVPTFSMYEIFAAARELESSGSRRGEFRVSIADDSPPYHARRPV